MCLEQNKYFFRKLYGDWYLFKAAQNSRTLGNTLSGAELVGKDLDKETYHFTTLLHEMILQNKVCIWGAVHYQIPLNKCS